MTSADRIRAEFESYIQGSERWKDNTPLGAMLINGEFHHYMNADTDTMWIGFAFGFRTAEALKENRATLLQALEIRAESGQ